MALDPSTVYAMNQVLDAIAGALAEIDIARDEGMDADELQTAHDVADAVLQEYEALLAPLSREERDEVRQTVAPRIADLKGALARLG